MVKQRIEVKLQSEMPTLGGSTDPADFDHDAGILDGRPPALSDATDYIRTSADAHTGSGTEHRFLIKKSGQGNYVVRFKMMAEEEEPVAVFSGTPTSGDIPLEVTFTDASTGQIDSWSWAFGDGGTSEDQNPTHTYEDAGSYTVTLTVSGPGGTNVEIKPDYIGPWSFFWFKLTRADGTLVDEALFSYFKVYNSSGASVSLTQTYDAETEYWTITPNPPFTRDPSGYWVEYKCIDGIETQYPDKYKTADKKKVANLIQPGTYEGTIHYYKTEDVSPSIQTYNDPDWCPSWPPEVSEDYFFWGEANLLSMKPGLTFVQKSFNVKSSVPYKITRRIRTAAISGYTKSDAWFAGEIATRSPSIFPGVCNAPGDAWCARDSIWEDGVVQIQFTGGSLDVTIGYDTTETFSVSDINNSPSIAGITDDIEVTDLTPGSRNWDCDTDPPTTATGTKFAAMYDKRVPNISATWDI